jgi:hypothetical protein
MYYNTESNIRLAVANLGFGSCQMSVWRLPNPGLAAAKLGSCAVATLGFGRCQTRVLRLPNSGLTAARFGLGICKTEFGSRPTRWRVIYIYIYIYGYVFMDIGTWIYPMEMFACEWGYKLTHHNARQHSTEH